MEFAKKERSLPVSALPGLRSLTRRCVVRSAAASGGSLCAKRRRSARDAPHAARTLRALDRPMEDVPLVVDLRDGGPSVMVRRGSA